jgi:hypothetical protein
LQNHFSNINVSKYKTGDEMNISPDTSSQAPLAQHLSGEVTGRMQGSTLTGLPNDSLQDSLKDIKKLTASSSGVGTSEISSDVKKLSDDLKKPAPSVDKSEKKDIGKDRRKGKGEFKVDDDKKKEVDDEKEDDEDDDDDEEEEEEDTAIRDEDDTNSTPAISDSGKPEVKKRRSRKKWKKPKDKPNRPLSAYNLFFRKERALMLGDDVEKADPEKGKKRVHRKTHGKIGFAQMARIIGAKWKTLPEEEKSEFEEVAGKEKKRYSEELGSWKEEQKKKAALERKNSKAKSREGGRTVDGDDEGGLDSMSKKQQEALKMQMMQGMSRSNLPFFGGDNQQRQMPTIEYLRAMQDDRAASSLFRSGRSGMGNNFNNSSNNQYPNAAEASASALLQQFQTNPGMMPPAAFAAAAAAAGMDVSGRSEMECLQQLQMARMQMMNSSMMGGPMGGSMNMGSSMVGGPMGTGFSQMGGSNNQQSQQFELERLQQQMFFQNKMAAGMNNPMMGGNFGGLNNSNNNFSNNNMNDMNQGGGGGASNNLDAMRRFQNRYNPNM